MRRRELITLIGGAALTWPLAARAQQPKVPVIGFLNTGSAGPFAQYVTGLLKGLNESGFSLGRNVEIEYRWAEGHYDRLPALAAELVGRPANVIVASGGEPSGLAAKAATSNIPIVFLAGGDPVKAGLVSSLNRPTGNLTGISQFTYSLEAKRLGLLHELAATADPIAVLINQSNPNAPNQVRDLQEAAARAGVQLLLLPIDVDADLDPVFTTLVEKRVNALLISADPFFNTRRAQIVALVARAKVPAMYEFREFAVAGGLMSYGSNLVEAYRQAGVYAGRILNGAKPTELPVLQPTIFELVINLNTAKALGFEVPPMLLARADEVIE
jgi:putative tryptophan/tyrosine transport system substrate-binding protein